MKIQKTKNISFGAYVNTKFGDFANQKANAVAFHYSSASAQYKDFMDTLKKIDHFRANDTIDLKMLNNPSKTHLVSITRNGILKDKKKQTAEFILIEDNPNFFKKVLEYLVGKDTKTELSASQLKKIKFLKVYK